MRNLISGICFAMGAFALMAEIPAEYYSVLEGKSGEALKLAVKEAAMPADFTVISYGSAAGETWSAFEKTDVRVVGGDLIWRDMYSNRIVYVATGHDAMNIEHSVANSWWGGKNGSREAYSDLFHLNPSDADANNKKSNNPLGVVADARIYDNGLVRIGTPASGFGGGAATVFEPSDEYKGDFARAYLYIFTTYSDISWNTEKDGKFMLNIGANGAEPQQWVIDMLLKWSEEDPVDDVELARNEEIYKLQKNRNPYIDFPALAEYVWGDKKGEAFSIAENAVEPVNRPADPQVSGIWLTGVNTYSGRYWGSGDIAFDVADGDLWVSCDGSSYQRYGGSVALPAASAHGERHVFKAYALDEDGGKNLRSSIVYVTMTGRDPSVIDYTDGIWTPVTDDSQVAAGEYYIIMSQNVKNVMGHNATTFMPSCGYGKFEGDNVICLPDGAALVTFVPVSGSSSQYTLRISDTLGNSKGYWNASGSNKMKLDQSSGTPASVSVGAEGQAIIEFAQNGSLKYNKTQPRFLNYSSSQGGVLLYRFNGFDDGTSGVDGVEDSVDVPVAVDGRNIIVPEGGAVYDLEGRRVSGIGLRPGLYIAVKADGKAVKILIH